MFSPIWGEGNGRGISGFAVNRGAVYLGFTVYPTLKSGKDLHFNIQGNICDIL